MREFSAGSYDVAVIGAGHAGIEASLACARLGMKTVCFTINLDAVGNMPCNPAIGGTGKGHLVRELDALGGEMAKAADKACIQYRMLNRGKGPAVHSLRAQADRIKYRAYMKHVLEQQENLFLMQDEVVAIEQKTTGNNPRSTVGTITEIFDFLRLLYARASRAYSPVTGKEMVRYTDEQIVSLIMHNYNGRKCYLLAPLVRGRKGHYRELFDQLRKRGFTQVRIDGELHDLSTVTALDRYKAHFIELVVDRLKPVPGDDKRVKDSVTIALGRGKGSVAVMDLETGELQHYSKHLVDPDSGISLQEPAPHSFSFNSPEGYCPHCKGLGKIVNVDIDAIIPDRSVSIADGGIIPLGKIRETKKFDIIRSIARRYDFSLYDPIEDIPDEAVSLIVYGSDELFRVGDGTLSEMVAFPGIVDDIEEKIVCPVCHGTRLNEQTNCFRIDGKTISEVAAMEMSTLAEWFAELPSKLTDRENIIARDILKELKERTGFMLDVGLDYLSLDRATASLSGGESQRIRLYADWFQAGQCPLYPGRAEYRSSSARQPQADKFPERIARRGKLRHGRGA